MNADDSEPTPTGRPASLRERKRTRMRSLVQAEALRLFTQRGYDQTTVDDIAHAAAMSPRTFFRYFATKEDVVLWDEYDDPPLAEEIWRQRLVDDPVAQPIAVIRKVLRDSCAADRERLLARVQIAMTVPEVRSRFVGQQIDAAMGVFELVARSWGAAPGDLRARVLAAAVYAAVIVAVERWQHHGGRDDLGCVFDEAIAALGDATTLLQGAARHPSPDG
ncbi:MAG: TetR family transcriptional regulator [Dactylosporangium sp.]|nr:TetR family transcriptional regulator [Dactylosporangium sp.]NNJ62809.1 TetR family transcriptional regulator [Dactylosporangium sp.]